MRLIFIALLSLFFLETMEAQKLLQLEKVNSPKTRKYFIGTEITFEKEGQWYTRVIEDVSYEENLIIFAKGHVNVGEIDNFRTYDRQKWSRPIGNQLINFAVAYTLFSVVGGAVDEEPAEDIIARSAVVGGTSAGLGLGLKKLFRRRTYSMKKNARGEAKKFRLRVLDLEVKKQ